MKRLITCPDALAKCEKDSGVEGRFRRPRCPRRKCEISNPKGHSSEVPAPFPTELSSVKSPRPSSSKLKAESNPLSFVSRRPCRPSQRASRSRRDKITKNLRGSGWPIFNQRPKDTESQTPAPRHIVLNAV